MIRTVIQPIEMRLLTPKVFAVVYQQMVKKAENGVRVVADTDLKYSDD